MNWRCAGKEQIDRFNFARIWQVMATGIERGMNTEGVLPGPLNVHAPSSSVTASAGLQR